jgi:hypothetical protein
MLQNQPQTKENFEESKSQTQQINLINEKLNLSFSETKTDQNQNFKETENKQNSLEAEITQKETQKKEPIKLSLVASHFHCEENKFDPKTNPQGRINFVTALNAEIPKVFHKHISDVIELERLCYQRLGGLEQLNEIAFKDTVFGLDETLTFHSLASVIDAFFHFFEMVSVENLDDAESFEIAKDYLEDCENGSEKKFNFGNYCNKYNNYNNCYYNNYNNYNCNYNF